MATMEEHDLVLHNIRAKLYPNHLEHVEGNYNARVDNERTLTGMEVCTAAKTRGGYPGDINEMYDTVKWYLSEQMYQICDGYAVSNDYYTLYPHISGPFESPHDPIDREKHKVSVRFSARKRLRDIQKKIDIEIIGIADTNGFIDYLIDQEEHDLVLHTIKAKLYPAQKTHSVAVQMNNSARRSANRSRCRNKGAKALA
jgi:hypothetical protein